MTGNPSPVFTPETFALLDAIGRTPTAAFYLSRKPAFKRFVEEPLKALVRETASRLPRMMRERLETGRGVFSRFLKNDFGRGGAWAHYWGAFYPRGSCRLADVQLAVWIDRHRLGFSFYIGDYAAIPRGRFLRSLARHRAELPGLLADLLAEPRIQRAWHGETALDEEGRITARRPMSWDEWLDDPSAGDFWAYLALTPAEALETPPEDLAALAARTHAAFFPLALLAMEDEPLPVIRAYLGM